MKCTRTLQRSVKLSLRHCPSYPPNSLDLGHVIRLDVFFELLQFSASHSNDFNFHLYNDHYCNLHHSENSKEYC